MKTQTYKTEHQETVERYAHLIWRQALRQVPKMLTTRNPICPLLIDMRFLQSAYFKHVGVFARKENIIVLTKEHAHYEQNIEATVVHELTHWLQHMLDNYKPSRDTHLSPSWSTACWVVAHAITNGRYDKPLEHYRPFTSVRNATTKRPVKQQREGSLSQVELHHFPFCIPLSEWCEPKPA
jgi:hypothetical protein